MTASIKRQEDAGQMLAERADDSGDSIMRDPAAKGRRIAILSPVFPSMPSGQSRVLSMLLDGIADGKLVLLSDCGEPMEKTEQLPAEFVHLKPVRDRLFRLPRLPGLHRLNSWLGMTRAVLRRSREIENALSPNPPDVVIACTASLLDIPAGWLAARRLGVPFFEYVFDDYVFQWRKSFQRRFARFWERRVMRDAAGVFAPNELLADEYHRRYGVTPIIVRNPAPPAAFSEMNMPKSGNNERLKILYTGSVYDAQSDAMRNLAIALERLGDEAELHLYTSQPDLALHKYGIVGPVVRHDHVGHAEIIDVQKNADILFLPLSFASRIPEVIRTSAPGKMGEYLASGQPILVHAPADSFISRFFTEKGCGVVVDRPDPGALVEAIERIAREPALRAQIVLKAKEAAQEFSVAASRNAFWPAVNFAPPRTRRRKRILLVAMAESIHTARWVGMLAGTGWDVCIVPATAEPPHAELKNATVYSGVTFRRPAYSDRSLRMVGLLPVRRGSGLLRRLDRLTLRRLGRPFWIALLIRWLKPDIVQSLEFQKAGYLALQARSRLGDGSPPWIATNWGSDIYLFGRFPDHQSRIRQILESCDYYSAECHRDVVLAREYGLRATALPCLPNGGGFDLARIARIATPGPTSARRTIALKGYHSWAGRALFALRALELCADRLDGYRVVIFMATPEVALAAALFQQSTGVPIEVQPRVNHDDMLKLHGQSRISVGLNISDGISTSVLEAMVMGSFPIQSDTSCCNEWIEDGVSGFIVPPEDSEVLADRIRRALDDDVLVDRAAEINAGTAADRLDIHVVRAKAFAMYEDIVRQSEARAGGL